MKTDKRAAILRAALEVFSELGFHGAPVPLISEKARVGAGTIYRYFRDKEHLVNELYRSWKTSFFEAITHGLDENLPLRALFHEIWKRWLDFALNNRAAYLFLVSHYHAPYLDEETTVLVDRLHQEFRKIFERGRREQVLKDAPPELLMAVATGIGSEVMKEHWAGRIDLTPELIDQLEEICWQAIRR